MEVHLRNDLSYSNFSDPGFRVGGGMVGDINVLIKAEIYKQLAI